MNNKHWAAVAGIILLAGIVASAIFLRQRNETRERLHASIDQIAELQRRNAGLNESLENQKSRLNAEQGQWEKKEAALTAAQLQMSELRSQLDDRQADVDTLTSRLQEVKREAETLQGALATAEKTMAERSDERRQLAAARDSLAARVKNMVRDAEKSGATIATLSQTVKEGDERVAALETRLKEASDERDGLMATMTALTAESGELRTHMEAMETRHRKEVADQKDKITELTSALESTREELEASNRTISDQEGQLQDFIARMPELKDKLKQSRDSYQAVRETLSETKARETTLEAQQKAMKDTYEALVSGLKQQLDSKEASIETYRQQLKVTFVDRILFGFSQVSISAQGKNALSKLASALASVPEGRISIVGHADNIPVAATFRSRFPSNWELSSARAGAVARYLLDHADIDPVRIETIGLSSYHPIADNDTRAGRAKNRRVEIIITPGRGGVQEGA